MARAPAVKNFHKTREFVKNFHKKQSARKPLSWGGRSSKHFKISAAGFKDYWDTIHVSIALLVLKIRFFKTLLHKLIFFFFSFLQSLSFDLIIMGKDLKKRCHGEDTQRGEERMLWGNRWRAKEGGRKAKWMESHAVPPRMEGEWISRNLKHPMLVWSNPCNTLLAVVPHVAWTPYWPWTRWPRGRLTTSRIDRALERFRTKNHLVLERQRARQEVIFFFFLTFFFFFWLPVLHFSLDSLFPPPPPTHKCNCMSRTGQTERVSFLDKWHRIESDVPPPKRRKKTRTIDLSPPSPPNPSFTTQRHNQVCAPHTFLYTPFALNNKKKWDRMLNDGEK